MKFFSEIKNRVNEAPHYPEDPDEWNAMFGARKKKPQGDPEDQDFERFSAQQDADADDEISQKRQAQHTAFQQKRKVGYVDHEGAAPNGQRYNKLYVIHAQDMQTANHEEYLFDKHEWGAKKVVDVKKEQNKNGSVTATLYIVDNHKYGTWKPWKDAETKESKVTEGNDDNPVLGAIIHRIMVGRVDLLAKYGPERIMAAAEDVADFVGDVEEIGSSDVSGWVKQVENSLKDAPVSEGVNHSALQGWDEMDANQKTKALQQAGFKKPFRQYNWSDKEGHGQYTWDGWSSEELDDILHAAKVKELDQADELTMSASDRRGLQRQAKQDFEAQRQQLHKEKMEMERFAWEKANTEAERKHEIAKIEKEYLHDLRKLQMGHQQDMEKILHADTHELNKMKAEFNMRQAEREKENVQEPATQQAAQNTNDQNFDQDTGAPLRPQQSDQWHTSQQVGYTPGLPGPDVTDVEVKPNKPFALGNDTKKESIESGRAVDAKGRTQAQWAQLVKSKFPGAKITQAKMIDGPMQATLPDGRKLYWSKVEQTMAEADMKSSNTGYNNMLAVMKAVDAGEDATFNLGGEPITLEYPEARFLSGKYKAFLKAGRQEEFLKYMDSPVAFDRLMLQLRHMIDKQKNFKGSVPGERGVEEATESTMQQILASFPEEVEHFRKGGELDYDLESALWEYYFNNGDIKNYNADASEFISQRLADELGLDEDAPALAKMAGGLGLGLVAAAGAPAIVGILGPLLGIPFAAYGAYSAAKMGMAGVEKLWDMATDKLGGSDKVEQYATAQIAKLPPEKAKAANAVIKQVAESRKTVESTGPAKMISRGGKDMDESAPPNFPMDLEKKLLAQYKNDPSRAYATMWTLHNKQKPKTESLKALPAVNENEYWCGNSRMAKPIPEGYKKLQSGYLTRK